MQYYNGLKSAKESLSMVIWKFKQNINEIIIGLWHSTKKITDEKETQLGLVGDIRWI